ncbi:mitochondrial 2-hydroxyacid dehydrogenase [Andalucia godoyi]|uniref:Mitochondrial 2-hydroxyacid dehydrogenase n=1 Tax=Andalucia godoyi TaxID=505711 RepID=A0A8K0AIN8_ANDGO|nr:mitochondrial 2-hydroxyacid dehydrogenase [Andalucia godoyi]|eukprot:ANDGO_02453.mRNA.1 mitochondrial 2-hydroxyacid dehydrogenase
MATRLTPRSKSPAVASSKPSPSSSKPVQSAQPASSVLKQSPNSHSVASAAPVATRPRSNSSGGLSTKSTAKPATPTKAPFIATSKPLPTHSTATTATASATATATATAKASGDVDASWIFVISSSRYEAFSSQLMGLVTRTGCRDVELVDVDQMVFNKSGRIVLENVPIWSHVLTDSFTFASVFMKSRPLIQNVRRVHLIDAQFGPIVDAYHLICENDTRLRKVRGQLMEKQAKVETETRKRISKVVVEKVVQAKRAVSKEISRVVCNELKALSLNNPVPTIRSLFVAIMTVLTGKRGLSSLDHRFSRASLVSIDESALLSNLRRAFPDLFKPTAAAESLYIRLLGSMELTGDRVLHANYACAVLYDWVTALIGYAEEIIRDDGLRATVEEFEHEAEVLEEAMPEQERMALMIEDVKRLSISRTFHEEAHGKAVSEYVLAHVLSCDRKLDAMRKNQIGRQWQHKVFSSFKTLSQLRIVVLGAQGHLGKHVCNALSALGVGCGSAGAMKTFGAISKDTDFVVNLLPCTRSSVADANGSLDCIKEMFPENAASDSHRPVLINVGELPLFSLWPDYVFSSRVIDWCDVRSFELDSSAKWWNAAATTITPHCASAEPTVEQFMEVWNGLEHNDSLFLQWDREY